MNNTKSPKNVSLKNQLELWLFCALIGAVAGALVWILLKIMAVGTEFLWKWLPGKTSVPYATGPETTLSLPNRIPEIIRRLVPQSP